jgi:hypothetical protein
VYLCRRTWFSFASIVCRSLAEAVQVVVLVPLSVSRRSKICAEKSRHLLFVFIIFITVLQLAIQLNIHNCNVPDKLIPKSDFFTIRLHTPNDPLILFTIRTTVTTVIQVLVSISIPEDGICDLTLTRLSRNTRKPASYTHPTKHERVG